MLRGAAGIAPGVDPQVEVREEVAAFLRVHVGSVPDYSTDQVQLSAPPKVPQPMLVGRY